MSRGAVRARVGFYGKLPSRGDFVRSGLSRALASAVDTWLQRAWPALAASGPDQAVGANPRTGPVWRLALAPGVCGPEAVGGVLLPSRDRVGRAFPLLVAVEGAIARPDLLDAFERSGEAAVREEHEPDQFARVLDRLTVDPPDGGSDRRWRVRLWRTDDPDGEGLQGDALPTDFGPTA